MLPQIDRTRLGTVPDNFPYAQRIVKRFGEIEYILDWCKRELEQEWRWQLITVSSPNQAGEYIFYFDSDRDLLAFTLKYL